MTAQVGPISVRSLRLLGTSVLTFAALLSISQPAQSQFVQLGPKLVGTGAVGTHRADAAIQKVVDLLAAA